jgi:Protein-L-isoaspartate(D-aspartate) O-methyltransferase (PCMT)
MVAVMTDLLELKPDDVLLEIGTGLGYHPQFSPSWRAGTSWPDCESELWPTRLRSRIRAMDHGPIWCFCTT